MSTRTNDVKKQPTVKILVGYHKPAQLLKSDILVPIHLGRALAATASKDGTMSQEEYQWMLDNMIGDDTGDNISSYNLYLNELTAIYWAWKNYDKLGNPEYFGFMHYRRHLCFDLTNTETPDQYGLLYSKNLDKDYIDKYRLQDSNIEKIISNNDIVVAEKTDLGILGTKTVYNHYKTADEKLHIRDLDIVIKILLQKYPEYKHAVKKYLDSKYAYFTNIFIAKKEFFFEYCEWLFDIIFASKKIIDLNHYNVQEIRALAYISEWLFGIFLTYKQYDSSFKTLELKRTFINNPDILVTIKKQEDVSVVFSADDNYAACLAVAIKSLICHASINKTYKLFILDGGISDEKRRRLETLQTNNVKIIFINIVEYLNKYKDVFFLRDHFSLAVYSRLFIYKIFNNYKKILYCDCDAIFLDDIANLYNVDISNHMIGAVKDTEIIRQIYLKNDLYYKNTLKLNKPINYFNSGVLIINIEKMVKNAFIENCVQTLKNIKEPIFPDQDVLNIVCENKVKFLDDAWNVENHLKIFHKNLINQLPYVIYKQYANNIKKPKFLHYTGCVKPWQQPSSYNADIWWKYARQTPFYEYFLQGIFGQSRACATKFIDVSAIKRKYRFHRLLSHITFGKLQKKQKQKARNYKHLLRDIKK